MCLPLKLYKFQRNFRLVSSLQLKKHRSRQDLPQPRIPSPDTKGLPTPSPKNTRSLAHSTHQQVRIRGRSIDGAAEAGLDAIFGSAGVFGKALLDERDEESRDPPFYGLMFCGGASSPGVLVCLARVARARRVGRRLGPGCCLW